MRSCGLSLRLFIEVRMDQDQMELEFPPEFLAACGRHGLGLYVISNDVPAAEFLERREQSSHRSPRPTDLRGDGLRAGPR